VTRSDGRADDELRPVSIETNFLRFAEGSALISLGETKVLCAASVEERAPMFLKGQGVGWVTAEYSLLPRSTSERTPRESIQGRPSGRTHEIQRLIGRALRSVVDRRGLGERTIVVDCDVLQADGGTRTAAITGAFLALCLALGKLHEQEKLRGWPLVDWLAATSVGILDQRALLDLTYEEDAHADVDFNVAMTGDGRFVEVQGTAEGAPFSRTDLDRLLGLAARGIQALLQQLQKTLEPACLPRFGRAAG
jgi:ribonuclease PH